jgi:hypothetical protein
MVLGRVNTAGVAMVTVNVLLVPDEGVSFKPVFVVMALGRSLGVVSVVAATVPNPDQPVAVLVDSAR